MRHKILDCIRAFIGVGDVDGIVEIDETFVDTKIEGYNERKYNFF